MHRLRTSPRSLVRPRRARPRCIGGLKQFARCLLTGYAVPEILRSLTYKTCAGTPMEAKHKHQYNGRDSGIYTRFIGLIFTSCTSPAPPLLSKTYPQRRQYPITIWLLRIWKLSMPTNTATPSTAAGRRYIHICPITLFLTSSRLSSATCLAKNL